MQREPGRVKPYTVAGMMLFPQIVQYLLAIAVIRFTAGRAAGLSIPAFALYLSAAPAFLIAVRKRVYRFVRIYCNNGFYINAKESSRNAVLKTLALSVPAALFLTLASRPLSLIVCATVKARLALYAACACTVIMGAEGVLFGFAEGMGKKKTVVTLDILHAVLTVLVCVPLAVAGNRYGRKLDDLLFTDDHAALYTVLFVFLGLLCTETVMTLILFFVRTRILKRLEPLHETGKPRYLGDPPVLYASCGPFMAAGVLPQIAALAGCVFLCIHGRGEADASAVTAACGAFYGRFFLPAALTGILCALPFLESCFRVPGMNDDIDTGEAGGRFRRLVHRQSILCFPAGLFLTALGEPFQTAVFAVPDDTAALLSGTCFLTASLFSFYMTICLLLVLTKRRARLVSSFALACVTGPAAGFVLTVVAGAGAVGSAVTPAVSLAVFAITGAAGLSRLFSCGRGRFRGLIAKPLLLSAVCALAMFLLSALLVHVIGELPTCIVCFFAGSFLYLSLMAFFRGFEEGDLTAVPLGRLFTRISLRGRS